MAKQSTTINRDGIKILLLWKYKKKSNNTKKFSLENIVREDIIILDDQLNVRYNLRV